MELKQIHTSNNSLLGFAESRIGGRSENQDSWGYADTSFGLLITVCDGMGGGPGGKMASTIAVDEIKKGVAAANKEEAITNILIKAIRRANMAIIENGSEDLSLKGMGSTCTVLLVNQQSAHIAHVGDSRVYQLRGQAKVYRTFDHSMVFDLVKQKVITEEQARLSAQSNVITRALGIKPDVEVDTVELPYESGDRFLLCSDGIHGSISEKELISILSNKKISLGALLDDLVTKIDSIGRSNGGGHDNLTAVLVETKSKSKLKQKMNKQFKYILYTLVLIVVISLVFNVLQATRENSSIQSGKTGSTQTDSIGVVESKLKIDSLKIDSLTKIIKNLKQKENKFEEVNNLTSKSMKKDTVDFINSIKKIVPTKK